MIDAVPDVVIQSVQHFSRGIGRSFDSEHQVERRPGK
jgi:hypothetical protein